MNSQDYEQLDFKTRMMDNRKSRIVEDFYKALKSIQVANSMVDSEAVRIILDKWIKEGK